MIAKKVANPRTSSGKSARASGLADYISEPDLKNGLEKCIHFEADNFLTDELAAQIEEMIALSEEAVRSKDPIDHWVLSWKENERPTVEQAREAVKIFIEHCGLDGHQVMWGLHDDTENIHIHIAVNRVNPETLKVTQINNGFDLNAAHQAIALIEHQQGWSKEENARYQTNDKGELVIDEQTKRPALSKSADNTKAQEPTSKAKDMEIQTGEKSAQRLAIEQAAPIIQNANSWHELHEKLEAIGMEYRREGSGAKIFVGDVGVKASDVDRKASFGTLQKRLGVYQPQKEIKPNDYHHHTKKQDAVAFRTSTTDRMRELSKCHMAELNDQGKSQGARVLLIDARLSGRQSDGLRRNTGHGIEPQPLKNGQVGWNEYRAIRDERKAAKELATIELRKQHDKQRAELREKQKIERIQLLKGQGGTGKGDLRNALQSIIATQQAAVKIALQEQHKAERNKLQEEYQLLPIYKKWQEQPQIVTQKLNSNAEQERTRHEQPEKLSEIVKKLTHSIDRQKHVTYQSHGKDIFRDEGKALKVLDTESTSLAATLAVAQQKFGTLTLTGTDEFKLKAVKAAVENNLMVKFSDPDLMAFSEQMRTAKFQQERQARDGEKQPSIQKQTETGKSVVPPVPTKPIHQPDNTPKKGFSR